MLRTLCPDALFVFEDCSRRSKVSVDLTVEVIPIRDDYECPVAGELS